MSETESCDRLRVDYTASVPINVRRDIVFAVRTVVYDNELYAYERYDKVTGAWSVEVTSYDRTAKHPISDEQVLSYLKSIADEKGVSISDILRAAEDM